MGFLPGQDNFYWGPKMSEVLNKLNEAGILCIKLTHAIRQDDGPEPSQSPISNEMILGGLKHIRRLMQDSGIASLNLSDDIHREELMKFSTIQSFLNVFEKRWFSLFSFRLKTDSKST